MEPHYSLPTGAPTPYVDVNTILQALLAAVQELLGDHFLGFYLYGSLALGDFNPQRSDIDFIVATVDELPAELIPALAAMHQRLATAGSPWALELEGSYIPQRALRRYDPARARHPHLDRGSSELKVEQHDSDGVILRHVLRHHGLTLAGPPPATLIDPVTPRQIRQAVLDLLNNWWAPMLQDSVLLHQPGYRIYAILTMCRVFYTLQHGEIVSKSAAARWAQATLGEPWTHLIEQALVWRNGLPADNLSETLDFLRYTVARGREIGHGLTQSFTD